MRFFLGTLLLASSLGVSADQWVNGYTRKDGTYVQPHARSDRNSPTFDNYSTRGNTNPYTGERGSRSGYDNGFEPLGSWRRDSNWDE